MKAEEKIKILKKEKKDFPKFINIKNFEDKSSKKIAILIAVILVIALLLLFYFFFYQYYGSLKKIKNLFNDEKSENSEFQTKSFSDLISACFDKDIGEACELNSENGFCRLSSGNETVCITEKAQ